MQGRIGTLHLRYRIPRASPIGATLPARLDRTIEARVGEAIDARVSALLGDDPAVVVIRELSTRVAVSAGDLTLDATVVDRLGRAAVSAVATVLRQPSSSEGVVRFADQAEFIGSFIVDLMNESAWEHWYYGGFQRHRRADRRATVNAVLDDHRPLVAQVFAWLGRRGHLDAVLALLGSATAKELATSDGEIALTDTTADDILPLTAAAFELLAAIGWSIADATHRDRLVSQYVAAAPVPPAWTDRDSLTAWILAFSIYAVQALVAAGMRRGEADDSALTVVERTHDWLDLDRLLPRLKALAHDAPAGPAESAPPPVRILAPRHEQALARLARLVRDGGIRFECGEHEDALLVRLLAALADLDPHAGRPDRPLVAAAERVVAAWRSVRTSGLPAATVFDVVDERRRTPSRGAAVPHELAAAIEAVRAAGPAALELLREAVRTARDDAADGELTPAAGLYLMTRAVLDVQLGALAADADVSIGPLRAALAMKWLDLTPPFDGPTALWVGAPDPDLSTLAAPGARLGELQRALGDLLIARRAIDAVPEGAPSETELDRIAWMVMRAWSRWLPGIADSSMAFLARNCLLRSGHVRASDETVDVRLDPAPFDVVLEMAGYLRPIERVGWLGDRTVTFAVRRRT